MLGKIGNKLERIEEEIFEGKGEDVVRDISNAKQEIINFRKIVRPQRLAFRDLERNKARYIAEDLDIYFDDLIDGSERAWDMLENYKEVVEGLEATNESAIAHRTNETFRVLTAISLIFLPLTLIASVFGMNVRSRRGSPARVLDHHGRDARDRRRSGGLLPAAWLAVSAPEEVDALAGADRPKRMLVIINPVATKMSERVKSLVVYALQGRYDVTTRNTDAKGHAIELCRQAAAEHYDVVVAFGGDGTVNEAANGLAGSRTALTCLPGGSNNVVAKLLGIPTDLVDATEHLLHLADRWEPRARRSRPRQRPLLHVRGRHGPRRQRRRARGPQPGAEEALRPVLLRRVRDRDVPAQVRRRPAAAGGRGRRAHGRRRLAVRAERRELHVLQRPPGARWSRARALTPAAWPASC